MPKIIFCAIAALCLSVSFAGEEHAYIYPAVLKGGENLLNADLAKWTGKSTEGCRMSKIQGTPFAADAPALMVDTDETKPNYWNSGVKVKSGCRYLVGAWVKNDNAKILLRFFGSYGNPVQRFDQRIYFFSGSSKLLENYLSEQVKVRLGGDPESWHLCYRLIETPETGKDFYLNLMFGSYFATGKITIAEPFVIEVTKDIEPLMMIDIAGDKPLRAVTVIEQGVRDEIWQRKFDKGETNFKEKVPGTYFERGLDKPVFEGYMLKVEYADGSIATFTAPREKTSKGL